MFVVSAVSIQIYIPICADNHELSCSSADYDDYFHETLALFSNVLRADDNFQETYLTRIISYLQTHSTHRKYLRHDNTKHTYKIVIYVRIMLCDSA